MRFQYKYSVSLRSVSVKLFRLSGDYRADLLELTILSFTSDRPLVEVGYTKNTNVSRLSFIITTQTTRKKKKIR